VGDFLKSDQEGWREATPAPPHAYHQRFALELR
jgi:hypothetical protein